MPPNVDDYTGVIVPRGFASLVREAINLENILTRDGAVNQAQQIRVALSKFEEELRLLAEDTAVRAHETIVEDEYLTRVRRADHAIDSNVWPHKGLADHIGFSDPLDIPGSVGINDERHLDDEGMGWWRVNEFGWTGEYEIRGWFFSPSGGPSRPSGGRFRQDPTFGAAANGFSAIVTSQPARGFVESGFNQTFKDWRREHEVIKREFIGRIRKAMASAPAPRRP